MSRPGTLPAITDHLPIALRAYAAPQITELREPGTGTHRKRRNSMLSASSWTVIFDTETTSDASQALRFGTYQVRNDNVLHEAGIFYDPDGASANELALLHDYAEAHNLRLITHEIFIEEIFFRIGYDRHANIVGFNLPFDISRIAIRHGSARGKMRGGFTFALSDRKWRPHVQIKHISRRSAFIQFAAVRAAPKWRTAAEENGPAARDGVISSIAKRWRALCSPSLFPSKAWAVFWA